MFSPSSAAACRLAGCGVNRSFLRYSRLCPYTLSRVESDVFELNGLDSLEELEQTLAGHGGLLGAMLDAPVGTGRFVSGFWAISEKYWQRIHYTLPLLLTKYVLLTTCKMSSWRGTTTRNSESRDFWIIWTTCAYVLPATVSPFTLTRRSPMLSPANTAGPRSLTDLTKILKNRRFSKRKRERRCSYQDLKLAKGGKEEEGAWKV